MKVTNGIYSPPPARRWFPVEIQIDGQRAEVVEIYAANKFDAFHMAITSMKTTDINRAVGGVYLQVLSN